VFFITCLSPPPQAYFGGEARCDAEAGQVDDYDPSELICGACSDVSRAQVGVATVV